MFRLVPPPLLSGGYATQSDDENGDVSYDEYADGYYWSCDAVFCENSQEYHYRYHNQVKPTLEGDYIHLGYPHEDWVEITYGYHAGEWSNNWIYDEDNDEYLTLTNTWRRRAEVDLEEYAEEYGWDLDALLDRQEFIEREDPDEDEVAENDRLAVLPEGDKGPSLTDDQHALYVALMQRPEVGINIERTNLKELNSAIALRELGLATLKLNLFRDVYEARAA